MIDVLGRLGVLPLLAADEKAKLYSKKRVNRASISSVSKFSARSLFLSSTRQNRTSFFSARDKAIQYSFSLRNMIHTSCSQYYIARCSIANVQIRRSLYFCPNPDAVLLLHHSDLRRSSNTIRKTRREITRERVWRARLSRSSLLFFCD